MVGQGRWLHPLLVLDVVEPRVGRVVEDRVPVARQPAQLLLAFGDEPGHRHVGAALVEVAVAYAAGLFPPPPVGIVLEPGGTEAALHLVALGVAPLRFVVRLAALPGSDDERSVGQISLGSAATRLHGTDARVPPRVPNSAQRGDPKTPWISQSVPSEPAAPGLHGLSRRRPRVRVPSLP